MKWRRDDIAKYEQARLYFDTLLIPVHAINVDDIGMAAFDSAGNLETIASRMEERLMGRVMLLPTLYYYVTPQAAHEWVGQMLQQAKLDASVAFNHVVFVVADPKIEEIVRAHDYPVFFVTGGEDDDNLQEMVEKGIQFLLDLWKSDTQQM